MFTVFLNKTAQNPELETLSFGDLAEIVKNPSTTKPKEQLRLLLTAQGITARTAEAVQAAQFGALVLDIDKSSETMADCLATLHGVTFAAYTTSSHKPEADQNSYRVILPLQTAINADFYKIMQKNLILMFNADQAMAKPSQGFYEPSANNTNYQHAIQQGQCIDNSELWRDLVAIAAQPERSQSQPMQLITAATSREPLEITKQRALDALAQMDSDCSYIDWVTIGASIKSLWGADDGYSIWRKWSATGKGYLQGDCNTLEKLKCKFDTFKTDSVTIATLFYMATQQGISVLPSEQFLQQQALDGFGNLERSGIVWAVRNENGTPRQCHENLALVLEKNNMTCHINVIKKREEIVQNGELLSKKHGIALLKSYSGRENFNVYSIKDFLLVLARERQYNPVYALITSKKWDGIDRLPEFLSTITPVHPMQLSNGSFLHEELILAWLKQAVCVGLKLPQAIAQGVLTLSGAQGCGKTTWFRNLVPCEWQGDLILNEKRAVLDCKDSIMQITKSWICELAELDDTFRKSTTGAIKAFISTARDQYRLPYDDDSEEVPRQTVFGATVNGSSFLKDATGNRRFWTIEVANLNARHTVDMQQLWAQIYDIVNNDTAIGSDKFALSKEAQVALSEVNELHMEENQLADLLSSKIDWDNEQRIEITLAELYSRLLEVKGKAANVKLKDLREQLEKRGIKQTRTRGRLFVIPPFKNDFEYLINESDKDILKEFD